MVAQYTMVNGQLEIKTLNSELVSNSITDTETLRRVFAEHKNNPELFNDPGLFKRVEK